MPKQFARTGKSAPRFNGGKIATELIWGGPVHKKSATSYARSLPRLVSPAGLGGSEIPPPIYSTELARSTALSYADRLRVPGNGSNGSLRVPALRFRVKPDGRSAQFQSFRNVPVTTMLVYGLVNVRTEGRRILGATIKEKGRDFEVQSFRAGADPL